MTTAPLRPVAAALWKVVIWDRTWKVRRSKIKLQSWAIKDQTTNLHDTLPDSAQLLLLPVQDVSVRNVDAIVDVREHHL